MPPLVAQAIGRAWPASSWGWAAPGWACLVTAVVAGVGVVVQILVPRSPVRRDLLQVDNHPVRGGAPRGMRKGVTCMFKTPWLLATLMVLATMGPFEVPVPSVIKDRLGGDAGDHAMVLDAIGNTFLIAGVTRTSLPRRDRLGDAARGRACPPTRPAPSNSPSATQRLRAWRRMLLWSVG